MGAKVNEPEQELLVQVDCAAVVCDEHRLLHPFDHRRVTEAIYRGKACVLINAKSCLTRYIGPSIGSSIHKLNG